MKRKLAVRVILAAGIASIAFVISSSVLSGYSFLGEGNPYPISYGFPLGFAYVLNMRRTIFLALVCALDFLIWFIASFCLLFIVNKVRIYAIRRRGVGAGRKQKLEKPKILGFNYCLSCGEKLPSDAEYCSRCGEKPE
mgnify:CR=1 FL=1